MTMTSRLFVSCQIRKQKKSYKASHKFQDTWASHFPWAELFQRSNGLYESIKCVLCSTIEEKDKILGSKWDTITKHSGKRKVKKNIANGIKKGQWYVAKNCKHFQNKRIFASRNHMTVAQQVAIVKDLQTPTICYSASFAT